MLYEENRGSEWKKWDLHVHTPASGLNNGFGQNETDWDNYVKVLFSTALANDVSAIAVTDYFLIDGYKKLKQEYLDKDEKLKNIFDAETIKKIHKILVLPNIEFRLETLVNGNRVNYHVIFSDKLTIEDIEDNFLSQIQINISHNPDGTQRKMALNKRALESLGRIIRQQQPTFHGSDYEIGCMTAYVSSESIINTLKNPILKEKYIIVTPVDEDLCKVRWEGQGHQIRKLIYQQSHAFFTSNPKTRDFALGKTHTNLNEYLDEFKSLKPCFMGSDAHSIQDIEQKLGKWDTSRSDEARITWVKADVTFNGLRQTLFEPETRVSIQSTRPEPKTDMHIIDSVEFKCTDGTFDPSRKILMNENLNAIIGGKSSGKSLLIYSIAQAINGEMVNKTNKMLNLNGYNFNSDFIVRWKDGTIDSNKTPEPTHSITYIPQLYINYLAEKKNKEELNDFVLGILKQNDGFLQFFSEFTSEVHKIDIQLHDTVNRIKTIIGEAKDFKKDIEKYGGLPDVISKSMDVVKKQIQTITEQSTLNESEKKSYQDLLKQMEEVTKKNEKNNTHIEFINKLEELLDTSVKGLAGYDTDNDEHFPGSIDDLFAYYLTGIPSDIEQVVNDIKDELSEKLLSFHNRINTLPYRAQQKSYSELIKSISKALEPLTKKQEGQKDIKKLQDQLNDLNQKLQKSIATKEKYNTSLNQYKEARKKLEALVRKRIEAYDNLVATINRMYSIVDDDNQISLSAKTYVERKSCSLYDYINKQRTCSKLFTDIFPQDHEDVNYRSFPAFLSELKNMKDGEVKFADGSSCFLNKEVALTDIFESFVENNFRLSFEVSYKNDPLQKMSPGKKGTVLLILFLQISTANYPILIDQPEDNLDNRTIYKLLCSMIKRKKQDRQIIIVTHNANLVVGTDSENVIVANQQGQIDGTSQTYKFEYVNGPIEYSFIDETEPNELRHHGIREHVCDILEGGEEAFENRERKYGFKR